MNVALAPHEREASQASSHMILLIPIVAFSDFNDFLPIF